MLCSYIAIEFWFSLKECDNGKTHSSINSKLNELTDFLLEEKKIFYEKDFVAVENTLV